MRSLLALLALVTAPGFTTGASPLAYDESIDGDLPNSGLLPVLQLDIGVNIVSGSIALLTEADDLDSFAFFVPAGAELISGEGRLMDLLGNVAQVIWRLNSGSAMTGGGSEVEVVAVSSPGSHTFGSAPLAAGLYNLSTVAFITAPSSTADWEFRFELGDAWAAPVPEPATALMIGSALISIGLIRLRRCRG